MVVICICILILACICVNTYRKSVRRHSTKSTRTLKALSVPFLTTDDKKAAGIVQNTTDKDINAAETTTVATTYKSKKLVEPANGVQEENQPGDATSQLQLQGNPHEEGKKEIGAKRSPNHEVCVCIQTTIYTLL